MIQNVANENPLNYDCINCDYSTCNIKDYNRHILTRKHIMLQNVAKKVAKNPKENPLKYDCVICDYSSCNKKDYNRHILTRKHIMIQNVAKENPKEKTKASPLKYECLICDYTTCKLFNYNKHNTTRKHVNNLNGIKKVSETLPIYSCNNCNKNFQSRTKLYSHNEKCIDSEQKNQPILFMFSEMKKENKEIREELQNLLVTQQKKHQEELNHFQQETHKQMLELAQETSKVIHNNTNHNTNSHNTINNRFNMNFFLNEQCKDAMNLTDFLNNIQVSLEDVSNVGRLGYADGISRIIINALKDMDVYERPIHCSDIKREIMYIKDNDIWEKDDERKYQMKRVLKLISHKNVKRLLDWREAHPGWLVYDSKEEAECLRITNESMGGGSDEENERLYKKMIRKIAHETLIDKKLVE